MYFIVFFLIWTVSILHCLMCLKHCVITVLVFQIPVWRWMWVRPTGSPWSSVRNYTMLSLIVTGSQQSSPWNRTIRHQSYQSPFIAETEHIFFSGLNFSSVIHFQVSAEILTVFMFFFFFFFFLQERIKGCNSWWWIFLKWNSPWNILILHTIPGYNK